MKSEDIEEVISKLDAEHMPTYKLKLTQKCWRDGFNAGKDNVISQLKELAEKLRKSA